MVRRFWKIGVTLLLVLAVMSVIGGFSSQPASESTQTSGGIVRWVLDTFFPYHVTLDAVAWEALRYTVSFWVRKTAHLLEFAALGASLALHTEAIHEQVRFRLRHVVAVAVGVVYALSDEAHQLFVEGRGARWLDVGVDTLGVLLGVACIVLLLRWIRRAKEKRKTV